MVAVSPGVQGAESKRLVGLKGVNQGASFEQALGERAMSGSRKRNRLQQAAATPIAAISVEDLPQDPPRSVRPRQDLPIAEIGTNG